MSSQIIKNNFPKELLFDFLNKLCDKNDKYFIFNKNSYKKGIFTNELNEFIESCKQYYHLSKQKYLERKQSYSNFATILRQICNFNKIKYTNIIKYEKSSYDIIYYIYYVN